jgi:hypothetical protein
MPWTNAAKSVRAWRALRIVFALIVGGVTSIWLGITDYETTTAWQLLEAQNAPFVLLLWGVVSGVAWALIEVCAWLAQRVLR